MAPGTDEIIYPRAPILEAVVELRYSDVDPKRVGMASKALGSFYDHRKDDMLIEGSLDFIGRSASFKETTPKFVMSSSDQTDALHLTVANAVWVRLAPYEGWKAFHARLEGELPKLLKALGNPRLTRIGLRYVNRIDFPMRDNLGYHEDYLSFRIVAGDILEPHDGFKWVIQKEFPELNVAAVVQSGTVQAELPGYSSIIFDIDIFNTLEVPSKVNEILECLSKMRLLKNQIFEAGITDKARELFSESSR